MLAQVHIETFLGKKAKDVVTSFTGVVSSISFDLYGCVQVVLTPPISDDGKIREGHWFDITRVQILDDEPVMSLPNFVEGYVAQGLKGCAEKPAL